jgi:Tfp pilus assembly protein PilE
MLKKSGFTVVELLIIIVAIALLVTISIIAFSNVQGRARDAKRVQDIATIKKKLELFHAENGYYPNTTQMSDATFRRDTLKIPDSTAQAPGSNSSLIGYCWAANTSQYCYVADRRPNPPGTNCTGAAAAPYDITEQCQIYSLSYRTEQDPNTMIRVYGAIQY